MLKRESTRRLNNGIEMPMIGLGVFKIPAHLMQESVESAVEAGYRMFDTAKAYDNEVELGKALAGCSIPRKELFVATKLWTEDVRKRNTRNACLNSLEKLGMDYIDLYLIHWPVEVYEQAWEEMARLYEEKVVKAIGVSNFDIPHMKKLEGCCSLVPAVHQIEFHPWKTQGVWTDYASSKGIHIEAYGPFMQGGAVLKDEQIVALAKKYGKTTAQIILRWIIQLEISVIPKSCNKKRIFENMDIFDFCLDESDIQRINQLNRNVGNFPDPYNISW